MAYRLELSSIEPLTAEEIQKTIQALKNGKIDLSNLDLSNNDLGNRSIDILKALFNAIPEVTSLNLSHNKLGSFSEEAATQLATALAGKKLENLASLNLGNNRLHNMSVKALTAILNAVQSKDLDLRANELYLIAEDSEGLKAVVEAIPDKVESVNFSLNISNIEEEDDLSDPEKQVIKAFRAKVIFENDVLKKYYDSIKGAKKDSDKILDKSSDKTAVVSDIPVAIPDISEINPVKNPVIAPPPKSPMIEEQLTKVLTPLISKLKENETRVANKYHPGKSKDEPEVQSDPIIKASKQLRELLKNATSLEQCLTAIDTVKKSFNTERDTGIVKFLSYIARYLINLCRPDAGKNTFFSDKQVTTRSADVLYELVTTIKDEQERGQQQQKPSAPEEQGPGPG